MLLSSCTALAAASAAGPLPPPEELPAVSEFPDPFRFLNGERVATRAQWERRRAEIRALLLHYEYGQAPPAPANLTATTVATTPVLGGAATEEKVQLTCGPGNAVKFTLYLTRPAGRRGPFPAIITGDVCWGRVDERKDAAGTLAEVVGRGYLLAEFDRTELDGDNADRSDGVHPLYPGYDWATLAAWAWGYHRVVDYLLTRADVDARHIAVTGHSRGGKTALLAGALDERIALTVPNDSGCGGAGSYRFQNEGSETLEAITDRFPYWFHPRLQAFRGRVEHLPFDQHFLLSLVAPRALLSVNALGDKWANPLGSQLAYQAAREVYRFLGLPNRIGIAYREGPHAQNLDDWKALLDFADWQFFGKDTGRSFDTLPFPNAPRAFSWRAPQGKEEASQR
ncbi:MAG: hypothetical protein QHJ73_11230 [Armatimonadota bacterium]|nr:hypothetical protein [Armatimonadota bacterium]